MKEDAIILHPLPRIDEISTDVDSSKQAKYFEQAENGKYTVNHSSPIILLKNGKYVDRITHKDDLKRSIKIIKKYL